MVTMCATPCHDERVASRKRQAGSLKKPAWVEKEFCMKSKRTYNWLVSLILFLLAATCLLTMILKSNQSSLSKPMLQTFTGEYSRDGETWYPLNDNADLNALNGDLFLRGHLSYDSMGGGRRYYYQNHIGVTSYLNGEFLSMDTISEYEEKGLVLEPSLCGSR